LIPAIFDMSAYWFTDHGCWGYRIRRDTMVKSAIWVLATQAEDSRYFTFGFVADSQDVVRLIPSIPSSWLSVW
jgi:hypothetical protein